MGADQDRVSDCTEARLVLEVANELDCGFVLDWEEHEKERWRKGKEKQKKKKKKKRLTKISETSDNKPLAQVARFSNPDHWFQGINPVHSNKHFLFKLISVNYPHTPHIGSPESSVSVSPHPCSGGTILATCGKAAAGITCTCNLYLYL